jgi:hypothetical protein
MFGRSLHDIFETNAGHFWGIHETRPYMRARFAVVDASLDLSTFDAVKSALDHFLEMLHLCHSDNMGVRDMVPFVMLRLAKEQDCYDFIKWWATADPVGRYDWGDMTLPYLSLKDEDVYEAVDYLCTEYPHASHLIAATLLKIRLLSSLTNYRSSALIQGVRVGANYDQGHGQLPAEIVDHIRSDVLTVVTVGDMKGRDPVAIISILEAQIQQLYNAVQDANKYFWPALLNPSRHLNTLPSPYSAGSVEEMKLNLRHSYAAWKETPDALAYIKTLSRK